MDNVKSNWRGNHEHKLFLYNTKNAFEPVTVDQEPSNEILYRMVEYAYLVCNCGYVEKVAVKAKA